MKPIKVQIKTGAKFGQDFFFGCVWPQDASPIPHDPNMTFDCTLTASGAFDLSASGYGGKPYGDGSLHVWSLDNLEMPLEQREAVVAELRARKVRQIADASEAVTKLRGELSTIV